jgi:low temperature requirement protein LtrA
MKIAVSRAPAEERVVTPLELFFDLVYVFAIGQLSHHLLAHVDLRTGAETAIMTLAVVYAWYMTAWGANWLDPDRLPVRLLLVGLMFASLLMSVSIADAFDGRAWLFVGGYLLLQVGRSVFLILALRGGPLGEHFINDLVWELATGVLWVAGAIAEGDARLVLWGLAVVGTQAGVWSLHWLPGRGRAIDLEHTGIAAGHLIERFRLFFIIALGETVLTTGTAFTDQPFTLERLIALIGIAVGDELAIAHPGDDATLGFTILAFGGPALFLLAQVFFLGWALGHVPRSRPLGLAALAILAVATAPLDMIAGIAASTAVLVATAIADTTAASPPAGAAPGSSPRARPRAA